MAASIRAAHVPDEVRNPYCRPARGEDRRQRGGIRAVLSVALGAEVFAERWTPIIVRNLMGGAERFGDILDGAPGLPRSVLAQRLRSLERAGVVERSVDRVPAYRLTDCGQELAEVCLALGRWGARWREVLPEHHDPYLVVWLLSRMIHLDELPRRRVVVRFDVRDGRAAEPAVAGHERGRARGVRDRPGLRRRRRGHLGHRDARRLALRPALARPGQRAGMQVVATPADERMLGAWGRLSPFADVSPAQRGELGAHARRAPATSISSVPIAFSSSPAAGKA